LQHGSSVIHPYPGHR